MRFDSYGRGDTQGFTDGDNAWTGIDMTRDRGVLQPGQIALGQNTRLRSRNVAQRKGTIRPPDFNPVFANSFAGSGIFRNPNGDEVLLIAPKNATYVISLGFGKDPLQINYSAAEIASGRTNGSLVEFVQSFDKVQLLRRPVQAGAPAMLNLVWDGVTTATTPGIADSKFEIITLSAVGLNLIPPMFNGEPFQDRVLYYNANSPGPNQRDQWIMSDALDYTSYDPVFEAGRTNPGESDFITRIMAYYHSSFLVFKNQSIHQVIMLPGTFPVQVQQRILSTSLGSYGNKMPLEIGGDIVFYNEQGFFRLTEAIQENIGTLPVAISEKIQPYIRGLNFGFTALWGCSASLDTLALFGVAVGATATRCNAVMVYDTQTSEWHSVADTWKDPDFGFNQLHVTNFNGFKRVFAVDYDNSVVYLLYEGYVDDMKSGIWSVPYKWETRGYVGDDPFSMKVFRRITATISTFAPAANITALSDGYNEEKSLTVVPIRKARTEFYSHGHKLFDPSTDDPNEPFRKDYSIPSDELSAIEDFESLPDGPIKVLPPTDIPDGAKRQQCTERRLCRATGRWISLRIENDEGACDVLAISVEGSRTMNTVRTAA